MNNKSTRDANGNFIFRLHTMSALASQGLNRDCITEMKTRRLEREIEERSETGKPHFKNLKYVSTFLIETELKRRDLI